MSDCQPTAGRPRIEKVARLMRESISEQVHLTESREANRTARGFAFEPKLPEDPFERWLREVQDACFQAGREWEHQEHVSRRPWWRLWDYAQRMTLRHAPDSRLRYLLEPEGRDGEVGYRGRWTNRYPDQPKWDFLLRFLWLFARNTRLRLLIAPDKN